jgi:hypothetical protein
MVVGHAPTPTVIEDDDPIDSPTTKLSALPPSITIPGWRPSGPAVEAPAPAPQLEEPVLRPRDWSHEPLPSPRRLRDVEAEPQDPPSTFEDEPSGPTLVSRVVEQLRNDPYIAVMAGLGFVITVLLLFYLSLRS